jgi:hypothetical protein
MISLKYNEKSLQFPKYKTVKLLMLSYIKYCEAVHASIN